MEDDDDMKVMFNWSNVKLNNLQFLVLQHTSSALKTLISIRSPTTWKVNIQTWTLLKIHVSYFSSITIVCLWL